MKIYYSIPESANGMPENQKSVLHNVKSMVDVYFNRVSQELVVISNKIMESDLEKLKEIEKMVISLSEGANSFAKTVKKATKNLRFFEKTIQEVTIEEEQSIRDKIFEKVKKLAKGLKDLKDKIFGLKKKFEKKPEKKEADKIMEKTVEHIDKAIYSFGEANTEIDKILSKEKEMKEELGADTEKEEYHDAQEEIKEAETKQDDKSTEDEKESKEPRIILDKNTDIDITKKENQKNRD